MSEAMPEPAERDEILRALRAIPIFAGTAVGQPTIERIGGRQEIPVDVRVVCATHQDLPAMIHDGRFREDLYYRLNVFPISVPPLRQRGEDVVILASDFAAKFAHSRICGCEVDVCDADDFAFFLPIFIGGQVRPADPARADNGHFNFRHRITLPPHL